MHRLAVALVHYRTPELLVPAVRALEIDAEASGIELDVVVVDNEPAGERPAAPALRDLRARALEMPENSGYAGGVNAAVRATRAPHVVAMNPDVVVRAGCLGALVDALESGADAAGPEFHWDDDGRILLPPAEDRGGIAELRSALAGRAPSLFGEGARRAWRRHARAHWNATEPLASFALSGALLAFRRTAWERIGPFDERYRLYFEETDWLLRLRSAGGRAQYVPAARAAHWHARSSLREPRAAAWFAEAERQFRSRHPGGVAVRLARRLRESGRAVRAPAPPRMDPTEVPAGAPLEARRLGLERGGWIELSPLARGYPAAAERIPHGATTWSLPTDLAARPGVGPLWARGVTEGGAESEAVVLAASGGTP